jgi:catechol 2,3-dioxygenase-like lactoylglutathione lyase family enzyme
MSHEASTAVAAGATVDRVVTYIHVADVDASRAFYRALGFEAANVLRDEHGSAFWALVRSGRGEVMFARASGPIDADQQAVLLYMYAENVRGLRERLLAAGVRDGGTYTGRRAAGDGPRMVYRVARPAHMPAGELRVIDADGYVVLVGQLA